jgi:ABC-type nitrate/sulfonate/bicarbonate transport system ATPase subunit
MAANAPLLAVQGVTLQYKTREHLVTATYRVSFDVLPSDRFVLLGPSGCGKSTLLKAVGGYLKPVEGTIRLQGAEVQRPGADRVVVMSARPGRIAAVVDVDLPRPRGPEVRFDPTFVDHVRTVSELLREGR